MDNSAALIKEIKEVLVTNQDKMMSKLDTVLNRLESVEKNLISLEDHRENISIKIKEITEDISLKENRLKDLEIKVLTIQVKEQGVNKVYTVLWGIFAPIIIGVIMFFINRLK